MKMFGRGKDCGVFVSGENINFIKVTRTSLAQCTYIQKAVDLDVRTPPTPGPTPPPKP